MSDEQMLAKYGYDKKPWLSASGRRAAKSIWDGDTLAPRPEYIPSRDPMPWVHLDQYGCDGKLRWATYPGNGHACRWAPRPWSVLYAFGIRRPEFCAHEFATRSLTPYIVACLWCDVEEEFARPLVNPILSAFRDDWDGTINDLHEWRFTLHLATHGFVDSTLEQITDARKVLDRFARVMEGTK